MVNWEDYLDECGTGDWGDRYFTTDLSDSMSVGPFCWNSCENCELPNRSLSFDGSEDYVSIDESYFNLYYGDDHQCLVQKSSAKIG